MGIEQRILEIIERVVAESDSDTDAARKLGVGQVTLYGWRHPRSTNKKSKPLYEALDKVGARLVMPDEKIAEYEIIPKYTAKAGAGSSFDTSDEVEGLYAFRSDWLQRLNIHAKGAKLIDVTGDSMEPTLRDGDTLLVDTGDAKILDGRIYVVTLHDELLVKRVRKAPHGIDLLSDNKNKFPDPLRIPMEDLGNLRIHGRVRWVGKEL